MKILFVGQSWLGSCARSLKEALRRIGPGQNCLIDEINEDSYIPKATVRWLRGINRILAPAYRAELSKIILDKCVSTRPDVMIVYKGSSLNADLVRKVKSIGIFTVNVFPDYSPHAYGKRLRETIGEYNLVVSTKPFHPPLWESLYGYKNKCVCVPHGYDPQLHLVEAPVERELYDVVVAANCRPQYLRLIEKMAKQLSDSDISVCLAGPGWSAYKDLFPKHWVYPGVLQGRAYVDFVRSGRIAIAPLNREVVIDGKPQPGDVDTSRTYELSAANCFFIHHRADFLKTIFDESKEVPMFDSAEELVSKIREYLPNTQLRKSMAVAAHRRAVPAYSLDVRATMLLAEIKSHKG